MAWMRKLVGRDRPAGDVRAHAERPRPRVVAPHARALRARPRPRARRCARRSRAGPVSLLLGLQTFHPFAYCPSWAPIGGASLAEKVAAMRDPALRAQVARRGRRRDRADAAVPRSRARVPDGRDARLRARRASTSVAALARARRAAPSMDVFYDVLHGRRRPRARAASAAQLHRLLARRGARDAAAPDERVGSRRRRRALRHDVRREHADVHAHALGARPRPRPPAARVGREEDDRRDRVAVRPRRSRRARTRARSATSTSSTSTTCSSTRPEMVHDLPGDGRRFVQGCAGLRRDGQARRGRSCATATTRARVPVNSCGTLSNNP